MLRVYIGKVTADWVSKKMEPVVGEAVMKNATQQLQMLQLFFNGKL
jgi:hypothetical protein